MLLPETPGHSQASLAQSLVGSLLHTFMTCVCHYSIIQSNVSALEILCAPPIHVTYRLRIWVPVSFLTSLHAETPILCSPGVKHWLLWKDPDAEKDWRQEEKVMSTRWMGGITDSVDMNLIKLWGDAEGQRCLACCHPWGFKELYTTERQQQQVISKLFLCFVSHSPCF